MSQTYANPDVHVAQGWAYGDGQAVLPEPSWADRVNDAKMTEHYTKLSLPWFTALSETSSWTNPCR